MAIQKSYPAVLRSQTRGKILRALLRYGPLSQQMLAHRTRLNQATVSRVLAELKRQSFTSETPLEPPHRKARGRPPIVVDLDRKRTAVLGIQLGLSQAYLGLVDLRGALIAETKVQLGPDPAEGLEYVIDKARDLIHASLPRASRLLGIGVGAAGLVDVAEGVVRFRLESEQDAIPVRARLQTAFGVPVLLSNNIHAMALAEAWFGKGREARSVALLYVARVIRLALVNEGRVYQGTGLRDGMFGHAVLDPEGPPCACGQRGCLEVLASDARLEVEAARLGQALPESILGRRLTSRRAHIIDAIVAAANEGDTHAIKLLHSRAKWLARAIVLVHYVLHPSQLLIAGTPQLINPSGIKPIQDEVVKLAPHLAGPTGVTCSTLGFPDIAVIGAATLVLEVFFSQDGRWLSAQERVASLEVTA